MKADHWEVMTTDSGVQDYGTSDFKGRPLDTAFARVTIRLKNAILGEYKEAQTQHSCHQVQSSG